jgi:hypothetical protein
MAVITPVKTDLNIPDDVRAKFPELIVMIQESKSMNQEERQYWVDVLPIMTEEQIDNLRSILVNEKKQIEEVNTKYAERTGTSLNLIPTFDEVAYKEKKRQRLETEKQHELEEEEHEARVLKELENL